MPAMSKRYLAPVGFSLCLSLAIVGGVKSAGQVQGRGTEDAAPAKKAPGELVEPLEDKDAKALLKLINDERKRYMYKSAKPNEEPHLVPALSEDKSLKQVAQAHAQSMARNQSIVDVPEKQLQQELDKLGYSYKYWAVVPALVSKVELKEAFKSWMTDRKHQKTKELLLNPYLADIGIGVCKDGKEGAYYLFMLLATKKK